MKPEPVPSVGSQVARYSFIREIARGPLGPLFECRKEDGDGEREALARVVQFPSGLPSFDEKQFSDAAWDSAVTTHELSVRVADVVFGKGWFTLVHDSTDGILLSLLEEKAAAFNLTFPPDVAVRIVLDVLEGLELSRAQSDAAQLNWRPGSVSPHSLNLCRDGRTRALDGHVAAAALHLIASNSSSDSDVIIPPEVLTDPTNTSERVDVFMVGALLWGLLTGRKLDLTRDYQDGYADIGLALPTKVALSKGFAETIAQAIKLTPGQRQGSLRELTVALVMSSEKVATYPEVIDFADALVLLESSRMGTKSEEIPSSLEGAVAAPATETLATETINVQSEDASIPHPQDATPIPGGEEAPPAPVELSAPARMAMISWADDDLTRVAVVAPSAQDVQPPPQTANFSETRVIESSVTTASPAESSEPVTSVTTVSTAESGVTTASPVESSEPVENEPSVEAIPAVTIGGSIDWGDAEASAPREKQSTLPGTGTAKAVESTEAKATPGTEPATTKPSSLPESTNPDTASRPSAGKVASKPLVTRAALTSNRPPKTDKPVEEPRSMRPPPSEAVKEVLLALEKKSTSKAPTAVESEPIPPPLPVERKLQISMSTLVLGFSTTVLAVIVIMLLVMRSQSTPKDESPSSRVTNSKEVKSERVVLPNEPLTAEKPSESTALLSESKAALKAEEPSVGSSQGSATPQNGLKPGTKPRTTKSSTSPNSKAASSGNNETSDESGAPGQKHPKNYVPNDL